MRRISTDMPNDDLQFRLRRHESELSALQSKMGSQKKIKELRDETQRTCRECRAELKAANEKTESKLQHLHEVVSRDYVLKDDFVRIMTSVDRKLDQVVEGMGELGRVLHEHLGSEAQK